MEYLREEYRNEIKKEVCSNWSRGDYGSYTDDYAEWLEQKLVKLYGLHGVTNSFRLLSKDGRFWLSVKKAKDCLFSRRNGYRGKIIFGYSVCIRLFGRNCL